MKRGRRQSTFLYVEQFGMYAAYTREHLHVMDCIIKQNGKYKWNRYNIGEFDTKEALVLHYLDIVEAGLENHLRAIGEI